MAIRKSLFSDQAFLARYAGETSPTDHRPPATDHYSCRYLTLPNKTTAARHNRWRRGCGRPTWRRSWGSNTSWAKASCCDDCWRRTDWVRWFSSARRGPAKPRSARLLARESRSHFQPISAVASGVKELREILAAAYDRLSAAGQRTLLFIDEIHRFNKAQQDVLLPAVEEGVVILVGATTENPFFTINSAAGQPQPHLPIRAAVQRGHQDPAAAGRGRPRPRPGPHADPSARRGPGVPGRDQRRRRPPGPLGLGGGRALQPRLAGRIHPRVGRRIGAAQGDQLRPPGRRALRRRSAR